MRCEILKNYENEIRRFCAVNGLSYDKIITSTLSWSEDNVFVLHNSHDPEREALGLNDNIKMPIALEIYLEDGKLRFEQTDITRKYLGVDKKVANAPHTVAKPTIRPSIPTRQKLAYA